MHGLYTMFEYICMTMDYLLVRTVRTYGTYGTCTVS